ncbi:GTP-binding protein [Thalassotalea sp. 1_MG-2023]|uniref:CobW family GTP-binding protein n=1 Tax=Thalassotalea sp. 1_MG-2023 TaxID=3062680 RepID=UPI0026E2CB5F|nr:GTP-binding protein [Thalassotalea sp. 1_MG-2023]MDO6425795.1 GTP-binding protein [Thalassotalea sp. 1_MG-2023]
MKSIKITAVPTNIITGFLGAGKTSAILQLLNNKPSNERWAVLVNEFGEIGVDGSFIKAINSTHKGVFIREVPGGCMCCAAGVPMQIALNQLLSQANPDRLLIEPTGLGHPKEVLNVLSAEHYQEVLLLQKTLTLVDARNLNNARYTSHDTFNQQIAIADTVIGNKIDLYQAGDKERLISYVKAHGKLNADIVFSQQGYVTVDQLAGKSLISPVDAQHKHHEHTHSTEKTLIAELPIPASGYLKAVNSGEGFISVGWRISPEKIFEYQKLYDFLSNINAERIKAVLITELGTFGYNISTDGIKETTLKDSHESCIEIIVKSLDNQLEAKLMSCIMKSSDQLTFITKK